jgi:hypothetical protein
MFWSRSKHTTGDLAVEARSIQEEIERSGRFDLSFGVMAVELSHSVPRGLSRMMPGKTISFHVLEKHLRGYDKIIGPVLRRYFVILPHTDREGAEVVKKRIQDLALERAWGDVVVGISVFPDDGKDSEVLLDKAIISLGE